MELDLEQPKIIFIIGLVFDLSDYVRRNQKTGSDKAWNNFWNPFKDVPNPVLRICCRTGLGTAWFILEISLGSAQSHSWNSLSKLILLVPNLDFIFMTLSHYGTGDLAQPECLLGKQIHTYLKNLWKLMHELLYFEIL